jgi:hypothetical protein
MPPIELLSRLYRTYYAKIEQEDNPSTWWNVDNDTLLLGTLPHGYMERTDGTIP